MIKVGDVFKTNRGGDCVVVEYNTNKSIIVEFCDEHKHRAKVASNQLRKGDVKNPFAPLLFGVGYHGVGTYKAKACSSPKGFASLPAYSSWTNMLSRCYDKNYRDKHLYENSSVDAEWHCFQTFADWYCDKTKIATWEGRKCLDKDILGNGNLYSKDTCSIVPPIINSIIAKNRAGKFLPGVRKSSNGLYRVIPGYPSSHVSFRDEVETHETFVKERVNKIKSLAEEYKECLDYRVYETLLTKDFRFKFSPFYR